jgi:hypothetical protein
VHIVWNEHDRDYRIDTIGGDFGNAQIIVTPLPDNLYSIQVYRDSKVIFFCFKKFSMKETKKLTNCFKFNLIDSIFWSII